MTKNVKIGIIFIFYIFLEVTKMLLYEVLFKEESRNYCEGELYLYPLVSDVKMALAAIKDCDIEE